MTTPARTASGISCGVDLVDIAAFERAIDATGGEMAQACFTDGERLDAAGRLERLATRWAVKEAVAKALGVGLLQGIGFRDVEVIACDGGMLRIALRGEAREIADRQRLNEWAISVSHERGLAIGFVVATQASESQATDPDQEECNG
jgi:holo-[acyl-carrier protein] synthase